MSHKHALCNLKWSCKKTKKLPQTAYLNFSNKTFLIDGLVLYCERQGYNKKTS